MLVRQEALDKHMGGVSLKGEEEALLLGENECYKMYTPMCASAHVVSRIGLLITEIRMVLTLFG